MIPGIPIGFGSLRIKLAMMHIGLGPTNQWYYYMISFSPLQLALFSRGALHFSEYSSINSRSQTTWTRREGLQVTCPQTPQTRMPALWVHTSNLKPGSHTTPQSRSRNIITMPVRHERRRIPSSRQNSTWGKCYLGRRITTSMKDTRRTISLPKASQIARTDLRFRMRSGRMLVGHWERHRGELHFISSRLIFLALMEWAFHWEH